MKKKKQPLAAVHQTAREMLVHKFTNMHIYMYVCLCVRVHVCVPEYLYVIMH